MECLKCGEDLYKYFADFKFLLEKVECPFCHNKMEVEYDDITYDDGDFDEFWSFKQVH